MKQLRIQNDRTALGVWRYLIIVAALLVCAVFAGTYAFGTASASVAMGTVAQATTPTPGTSDQPATGATPPGPVATSRAAGTATAQAGLSAVQTGSVPAAISTGGTGATTGGTRGTTSASSGDNTLLWIILLVIVVAIVALIAIALMRQRRPAQAAVVAQPGRTSDVRRVPANAAPPTDPAVTAAGPAAQPPANEEAVLPEAPSVSAGAAAAAATTVPLPQAPANVTCPNCGTVNSTSENFCHECGQDLRPALAALAATAAVPVAAPPVDVVEADTPYLETLDRADEQLEFVLSRPRVVIGTAPGNDIVVDSGFKGWQTVSPVHAELRREQEGFVILDRDSEYGTFVNEMRTGENILSDGDLVRLGDVRFVFHVPSAEE